MPSPRCTAPTPVTGRHTPRGCCARRPSRRTPRRPSSAAPRTSQGATLPLPTCASPTAAATPPRPTARATARGIAVKVYLPDGGTTDIVGLTLPVFFVRTPEDLLAFNEARRLDPATGQPDMEKVGAFLAAHPETVPAVTAAHHGADARELRPAHLPRHPRLPLRRRRRLRPPRPLAPRARRRRGVDQRRRGRGSRSRLPASTSWPTGSHAVRRASTSSSSWPRRATRSTTPPRPGPKDRDRVRVATRRDHAAWRSTATATATCSCSTPRRVPDGIELTADPILHARSGAYRVSVARRTAAPA